MTKWRAGRSACLATFGYTPGETGGRVVSFKVRNVRSESAQFFGRAAKLFEESCRTLTAEDRIGVNGGYTSGHRLGSG